MDPETSDAVTDWEPVAVGSGLSGLESLVADEFCGAVTDGLAWAFLLNGRIVGVFDGSLDAFDGADLTAYRAPDPALPLLFTMRESDGEVRGQYYTQKTPLAEVHRTLSSGNFTGYVELSENVLSGDYYVVYHGGRSMNVAFVGASERLVSGDEAFDLAADEVGIYTVTAVDIDVVDLSDRASSTARSSTTPSDSEPTGSTDAGAADDTGDVATAEATATDATDVTFGPAASDAGAATDDVADEVTEAAEERPSRSRASDDLRGDMGMGLNVGTDSDPDEATDDHASDDYGIDDENDTRAAVDSDDTDTETTPAAVDEADDDDAVAVDESDDTPDEATPTPASDGSEGDTDEGTETAGIDTGATNGQERSAEATADESDRTNAPDRTAHDAAEQDGDAFTAEREWQTTRHTPSIAPEDSEDADESATAEEDRDGREDAHSSSADEPSDEPSEPVTEAVDDAADSSTTEDDAASEPTDAAPDDLAARLERAVAERDELAAEVDRLASRLRTVTDERDDLQSRLTELQSEVDRLREAVAAAEAADSTGDRSGSDGRQLSPAAAREGTNLFVRYRSKSEPTLSKARTGEAAQTDVIDNLRLEYHTTFDSESTTVAGDPYETFLHDSLEWQFVSWVVEDLLYEIGRAGYRTELAPLFDAIPEIDRIQFGGEVPVTVQADGKDSHESRTFDLVFWNSMGDPLFVVNVDTDRDATTQSMVGSLIEGARAVGTSKPTLSGGFYVSNSFFDPGALDAVSEATKSGLLNRGSKRSFVKLSRKEGYHLCLVEARGGEFHLTVPEL